jgi:hypothetical protein
VGTIDFFGYKGLDVEAVTRALPFHVGDPYDRKTQQKVRDAVLHVTGRATTDVAAVCCDSNGDQHIYIGLAGASSKAFAYNPAPQGSVRLSADLVALHTRLDEVSNANVHAGDAGEDDSQGYALSSNPSERELQLKVREYALRHEKEIYAVLELSSDAKHRAYAADAVGYGRQSSTQIAALVRASRDADETVRNDATRALGCLAEKPELARRIPPGAFVEMINSSIWTDRNKAGFVLDALTAKPDPKLLALMRAQALDSIVEMARWHDSGHNSSAISIFARMAGVPEEKVEQAAAGPVEGMLALLR